MKRWIRLMLVLATGLSAWAGENDTISVSDLKLQGEIEGENITFVLTLKAEVPKNGVLPLVVGDVAYLDGKLPKRAELTREGGSYLLNFKSDGRYAVTFRFASRAAKEGEWRKTGFSIPVSTIRKLSVVCDRPDLEVNFPGALNVTRQKAEDGKAEVTAFLGSGTAFDVRWKPEIRHLESDLAVACEANTIATTSVGALRMDTLFTYRVIQGRMNRMELDIPDVNITQVRGEDIQTWQVERAGTNGAKLVVVLGRPREDIYRLQVEYEMPLAKFPTSCRLPVLTPRNVMRTSGFLLVGTDNAVKLQVQKAAGLTQVDPAAFPEIDAGPDLKKRARPARTAFAYQYANMPFAVDLKADDIATTLMADNQLVLTQEDNELHFAVSVQADVKDAPARELIIETLTDPTWTVTSVTGQHISEPDVDFREENGRRLIVVPFREAVLGPAMIQVQMEKTLSAGNTAFEVPVIHVRDSKSERGCLVLATDTGTRLSVAEIRGLQEIHTGSVPVRVPNAQQAYRFRDADWALSAKIDKTATAIHSESFHLLSIGEGVLYGSVTFTYHVSGAPVQEFVVQVPESTETIEFTGADIEGWTREKDRCTVRLQKKILGDYTMLATYNRQWAYHGAEIPVGGIQTLGTESEVGYIAAASSANISVREAQPLPASIFRIERAEVPSAYAAPVSDPIIGAWKYVRGPHEIMLNIVPYDTAPLLDQVSDYVTLSTLVSRDGETVTHAVYYIKNASRQYLVLRLPAGASLWSVKRIAPDGTMQTLASQTSEEGILVPVDRPKDPNDPLQVEVTYAESKGRLGFWWSGLFGRPFRLPELPHTHATFVDWRFELPEGYVSGRWSGNMTAHEENAEQEPTLARLVTGSLRAFADGRGGSRLRDIWTDAGSAGMHFTRTVVLADTKPVKLRLWIVPAWVGYGHSAILFLVMLAAGWAILLRAYSRKGSPAIIALGLALVIYGLTEALAGRLLLALAALACVVVAIIRGLKRAGIRRIGRALGLPFKLVFRRRRKAVGADDSPFEYPPVPSRGGHATTAFLAIVAAVACAVAVATARAGEQVPVVPPVVAELVSLQITGPKTDRDAESSADIEMTAEFLTKDDAELVLLGMDSVVEDFSAETGESELVAGAGGYHLKLTDKGRHVIKLRYRLPVKANQGGLSQLDLDLPENMRNRVVVTLPEPGLDIQAPAAVLFKARDGEKDSGAEAVFGPVRRATLTWRPRARVTKTEAPVFYTEVQTLATLRAGVVDMVHTIRFQIAQGEMREFVIATPEGMSVTAVQAAGLATWSFDPAKRRLEVILETAVTGDFPMTVLAQSAVDGLPYHVRLGAIRIQGSARQRGSLAVAAPENVQVRVGEMAGTSPMHIEDFVRPAIQAAKDAKAPESTPVRRAFRYHEAEAVALDIDAEQVTPEVRVAESASVSISDERTVLATRLTLQVAKAGIFSAKIMLPSGFEVETLTGPEVSHWDEVRDSEHAVVVHFSRQVTDQAEVNLVVTRAGKGIEPAMTVPRITVDGAAKHAGRVTVSAERGVRLMVEQQTGVDAKKAGEEGIRQAGVLVFDLLRPNWEVKLKADVMAPSVRPEVLHWVDLAEGMLQCRAFIHFRIENAGVKTFQLQAPMPGVVLSVSGRNVARVLESDKQTGIWQVDLHNKVEDTYALTVNYQVPYDSSRKEVTILPLQVLNADIPRGYLVVTCAGRVQVQAQGDLRGLKVEDPRNVPPTFGAGDMSGAVLCYRTVRPDYALNLSVVRHKSADVLPASIDSLRMTSVISGNRRMLTTAELTMTVGDQRFLEVTLPDRSDSIWTVLVNGREVTTSRDGALYRIPLEGQSASSSTTVNLVYAGKAGRSWFGRKQKHEAPRFGLPLNNIEWQFFVPPDQVCSAMGGTMEPVRDEGCIVQFDSGNYVARNQMEREANLSRAREVMSVAGELAKAGKPMEAKEAFQQAYHYSQGDENLNEDARVQLRNLVRQQVKVGLVHRRSAVRTNNNIVDGQQDLPAGFSDGEFTQEYAETVEKRLSEKDRDALSLVADKMIEQQSAAAGVTKAIAVTLPEDGQQLLFRRAVQVDPKQETSVEFAMHRPWIGSTAGHVILFALLFGFTWLWLVSRAQRPAAA